MEVGFIGRNLSPGPQWHKEYTAESKVEPRVLMIDYLQGGSLVGYLLSLVN